MSDEQNTRRALLAIFMVILVTLLVAVGLFFLLIRLPILQKFPSISLFGGSGAGRGMFDNGAVIRLGHYEQDNVSENGEEPIEWIVLDTQDDRCVLLSRYVLDVIPYHKTKDDVTWETSFLRNWLNNEFYQGTFNSDEQGCILLTKVDNTNTSDKVWGPSVVGNDTEDHVFLLSHTEALQYFETDTDRSAPASAYSIARGVTGASDNLGEWWLRSPGSSLKCAELVTYSGYIISLDTDFLHIGIRPAISISKTELTRYMNRNH